MELGTKKSLFSFGMGAFGRMASFIKNTTYLPQKPNYLFKLLKMAYTVDTQNKDMAQELVSDKDTVAKVLNLPSLKNSNESINKDDVVNALSKLERSFIQSVLEVEIAQKYNQALSSITDSRLKDRWKLSIKAAIIAKSIAKWKSYDEVELAYFATLLSELPALVLAINDIEAHEKIQEKVRQGMNEREAEIVILGFDHNEFGSKLFKYYAMPTALVELTQNDFRPDKLKAKHQDLARIVNFSKSLAKSFSDKKQSPSSIWSESQSALKEMGLNISPEEWGNKISLMFVKSIEFEMSVQH